MPVFFARFHIQLGLLPAGAGSKPNCKRLGKEEKMKVIRKPVGAIKVGVIDADGYYKGGIGKDIVLLAWQEVAKNLPGYNLLNPDGYTPDLDTIAHDIVKGGHEERFLNALQRNNNISEAFGGPNSNLFWRIKVLAKKLTSVVIISRQGGFFAWRLEVGGQARIISCIIGGREFAALDSLRQDYISSQDWYNITHVVAQAGYWPKNGVYITNENIEGNIAHVPNYMGVVQIINEYCLDKFIEHLNGGPPVAIPLSGAWY